MKKLKLILGIFLIAVIVIVTFNYKRLNIITGFSAKSVCSCAFEANRSLETTENQDNGFSPINLANNKVDDVEMKASSSVFGLKKRTAIYKNGIGCILVPTDTEHNISFTPNRFQTNSSKPYPYGNLSPIDTLFENINYKLLEQAVENAFDNPVTGTKKTRAVVVLYKGNLIAEKYAEGFDKNSKFLGWSMTKSITSAVAGILANQGKVNLQQNKLFELWENDERSQITLANLLQMNSGLEWVEDYNSISDVTKMLFLSEDMGAVQLQKKLVGKPNQSWNYSSGTTNLISKFIRNQFSTHQAYLDFWYAELIDKIGMHSMVLETDWVGNYVGSSYSWATARDWAKFGQLYLNEGTWNGEQILTNKWVEFTKTPTNTSNGQYGAQFWLNAGNEYPNVPKDMFYCKGYQGQFVIVIPSKELVVVRFGLAEHPAFNLDEFLKEIINTIQ